MNNLKKCGLIVLLAVHALCAQVLQARADDLVTGFQDPSDEYKPSCYWYRLNSDISNPSFVPNNQTP